MEFQLIPFVLTKVFHTSNSMRGSRSMPRILLSLLNRKRRYVYATQIFGITISIHLLLAGLTVLLGETIGVWFLNTHMNIPSDRIFAGIIQKL